MIPIRWRLLGIGQDGIGQEFSTKTDTGIVEPMSNYELQLNYYASRPRSPASQKNKLSLKLEVNLLFCFLYRHLFLYVLLLDIRYRRYAWCDQNNEYSCYGRTV